MLKLVSELQLLHNKDWFSGQFSPGWSQDLTSRLSSYISHKPALSENPNLNIILKADYSGIHAQGEYFQFQSISDQDEVKLLLFLCFEFKNFILNVFSLLSI